MRGGVVDDTSCGPFRLVRTHEEEGQGALLFDDVNEKADIFDSCGWEGGGGGDDGNAVVEGRGCRVPGGV